MNKKILELESSKYYFVDKQENSYTIYFLDDENYCIEKNDKEEISFEEFRNIEGLDVVDFYEFFLGYEHGPFIEDESWRPIFNDKGEHISDVSRPVYESKITGNIYWRVTVYEDLEDEEMELHEDCLDNILIFFKERLKTY